VCSSSPIGQPSARKPGQPRTVPTTLHEIHSCEVCGGTLRSVLDLGQHPMCDDLVPIGNPRVCHEYPIEVLFCDNCITAHQRFQIPKQDLFPQTYHYRSRHTADVLNGMRELAEACDRNFGGLQHKAVLDVGCNDGSLLSIFREFGATTFGIEPTGAAQEAIAAGHTVFSEFLTQSLAERFVREYGRPDVITFTNVFAHIEDLPELLRALKVLSGPETLVVIENHYLGAVLENHQFDTFYHEHPRTYSYTSLACIANTLNMRVAKVEFPRRYGGNIRVFMLAAKPNTEHDQWSAVHPRELGFGAEFAGLNSELDQWRRRKRAELENELRQHGPLPAKAFPGRAALLIKLLGIDERLISAVYEKPSSAKIGHYVPGTRIPIKSDEEFAATMSAEVPLLNLAWHIPDEIAAYMRERGYNGRIIDIVSDDDFVTPQ
jgi:hypothetical protein